MEPETYQTPKLVAQQLGVSSSGLRRLAAIYESVHGPLPKDALGGRMWTTQAVARLSGAKALHDAGSVRSVKEALERPDGLLSGEVAALPERHNAREVLERVLEELVTLRQEVAHLRAGRELPGASESDNLRRAVEAEHMNRYLLGELERRRLEAEAQEKARPWWRRLVGR